MHGEQHSVFLKIKSTCRPFINVGIHLSILGRMGKEKRKRFHSPVVWLFTFNSSLLSKQCEILSKAAAVHLPQSIVSFYSVLLRLRWEHLVATQNWLQAFPPYFIGASLCLERTTFITITVISPSILSHYVYYKYFDMGLLQLVWILLSFAATRYCVYNAIYFHA